MDTERLRNLIKENFIQEALDQLTDYAREYQFPRNDLVYTLSGRFASISSARISGTISREESSGEEDTLRRDLLEFLTTVERWMRITPEKAMSEEQVAAEIEQLAREFDNSSQIENVPYRLRQKNNLVQKISERFIQKPQLVDRFVHGGQPGIIAGIARKIQRVPGFRDVDVLHKLAAHSGGNFERGNIVNALSEIIYSGQLNLGDDRLVFQILDQMQKSADKPLLKNIERVRAALEYLLDILPSNVFEIRFYDEKVKTQYMRFQEMIVSDQLTPSVFITVLSSLLDRGTFRHEPCIRACNTQRWTSRWLGAYDTYRFVVALSETIQPKMEPGQRDLLRKLQRQLFRYFDAMGAWLFEEIVNPDMLPEYIENKRFPVEKQFKSLIENTGEVMPDKMVQAINKPLQESILLADQLMGTIHSEIILAETEYCVGCICRA